MGYIIYMNNNKKVIYIYEISAGVYNIYTKKETIGNSTALSMIGTITKQYVKYAPVIGSTIIIDSKMITGNNIMYIDVKKAGRLPVCEYIRKIVFSLKGLPW